MRETQHTPGRKDPIFRTRIYPEGKFWRWLIVTVDGKEYRDGGNYLTREAAFNGLKDARAALARKE